MELPDPNSYEKTTYEDEGFGDKFVLCASCQRSEQVLRDNVDAHTLGCAFRSRYWAIWHYNKDQSLRESFQIVEAALKKLDGDNVLQ